MRWSTLSRAARGGGVAVGAQQRRSLGQHHQQRGLGVAQAAGGLAEVGAAGGLDAFEHAAHRGVVEVEGEDLVLRQAGFELQRAQDLAALPARLRGVGSRMRATCMVIVEPPETMRPLMAHWPAARTARRD
jgi:hypothetical protein